MVMDGSSAAHTYAGVGFQPSSPPRGVLDLGLRQRLVDYVERHLAEPIPVERLAKLSGLSRYHFCRSFRRSFGLPPHRFHVLRRIERAKRLLSNAALSVTAIAFDVGFSEASSFATTFRKLVGQTPTGYRRSLSCIESE